MKTNKFFDSSLLKGIQGYILVLSLLFIFFTWIGCAEDEINTELVIVTKSITEITSTSAKSGGTISYSGVEQFTIAGICWGKNTAPDISNKTVDASTPGEFNSLMTSLEPNTTYFVRAYAIVGGVVSYGNEMSFKTSNSGVSYGSVTDIEGNVYKTVRIGTQNWMAENLRSEKYNDGVDIQNVPDSMDWINLTTGAYSYYRNNKAANKIKYGALYNGFVIGTGKICPNGWHVPSNAEWQTLLDYLAANGFNYDGTTVSNKVAVAMSEYDNWNYATGMGCVGNDDYKNLHNKSGFSARPAGYRMPMTPIMGSFLFLKTRTTWWTSDAEGDWGRGAVKLSNDNPVVTITGLMNEAGSSCRCIEN